MMIFITDNGHSTCNGDSGGPLVVQDTINLANQRLQIGVTSFGSTAGCEAKAPVAFANVLQHIDWITSTCGCQ